MTPTAIFSVMKRAYMSVTDGRHSLRTGQGMT
jgi:hypothetical protein